MVLSSQSVPFLKESVVTDKKTGADEPEPVESKAPVKAPLGKAAASGDAGVQNLLAHLHIHMANGDADQVAQVKAQLAELGYE